MRIIESTRTFTPEEVYHLTKDPQIEKLSKHAGELLAVFRDSVDDLRVIHARGDRVDDL